MLIVSSTLLLLVNAVTLRRDVKFFFRVAILTLLYYGIKLLMFNTWIDMYDGLFHSFITHTFDLFVFIIGGIVLQFSVF